MKVVNKIWGQEKWIVNNTKYCGKILLLLKQHQCSYHYHKNKSETFYILNGRVFFEKENKKVILEMGDKIEIKKNQKHRFTGLENSCIIEISTHHEDSDSYRQEKSKALTDDEFNSLKDKYEKSL